LIESQHTVGHKARSYSNAELESELEQNLFKIDNHVPLPLPHDTMPFRLESVLESGDAAGEFRIEFAPGLERPPIGRDAFGTLRGRFVGRVKMPVVNGQAIVARCFRAKCVRISWVVTTWPFGTLRMAASTSRGAGMTKVPLPHLRDRVPSMRATFGRSLSSASFSRHVFRRATEIALRLQCVNKSSFGFNA
jgi:hypothetical protein